MSTKRISIWLSAEGGKQLKAEFQGVGESGKRNLRKISREAEIASAKLRKLTNRAKIAGRVMGVALAAAAAAMLRHSFQNIDAQAKLAASLRTTTESIQVLERAGDLAGVSMGQVEQATIQLTKRLSQAVTGTGPAVDALDALHLSAVALSELPLDERIAKIQDAIEQYIPVAERAAVSSQLFGDRAGLIFTRIDSATLRQATKDVRDFELAVSEEDAAQIQKTNDALSRMALIVETIGNKLAVAMAPALESLANKMEALVPWVDRVGRAMSFLWEVQKLLLLPFTTMINLVGKAIGQYDSLATNIGKVKTPSEEVAAAQAALNGALGVFHDTAAPTAGANAVVLANDFVQLAAAAREAAEAQLANLEAMIASRTAQRDGLQGAWGSGVDRFADQEISQLAGDLAEVRAAAELARQRLTEAKAARAAAAREVTGGVFAMADSANTLNNKLLPVVHTCKEIVLVLAGAASATSAAAEAGAEDGETVATAWQAARDALANYADAAEQSGAKIADTITSAFSKAESMIAKFVETGKFSFKDLANSIIADLTRIVIKKQILGPLAEALNGAFSGGGFLAGLLGGGAAPVPVNHAGGMVGGIGPTRMVPAGAFAGAPRMHNGGWAGLRPDEIPTILQKGERVLSRQEVAAGGAGGGASVVNVTIVAKDVESFRRARTQIAADLAQAVQHGQRGL